MFDWFSAFLTGEVEDSAEEVNEELAKDDESSNCAGPPVMTIFSVDSPLEDFN